MAKSDSVFQSLSGSSTAAATALIEPHRATLCLSTPPKAINSQTHARTKYSLVTYSYSKAAFGK